TILYTAFGGLLADAITDMIQGTVLIIAVVIVFVAVIMNTGGLDGAAVVLVDSARIRLVPEGSWLIVAEAWAIPICGSVIATELIGRILGARTHHIARNSSIMAGGLYILIGSIPVFFGLMGAHLAADLADPEQLLPVLAQSLLPAALFTVFAGGVISAILSTVNSTLLMASGLLSHNLLVPLFRLTGDKIKIRLARLGVLGFGIVAYILAVRAEGVFALVEQASAFGSAGVLVTVSFGLFTRWGGPRTATCTLVTGVVVYSVASYSGNVYPFLLSLAASLFVYLTGTVFGQLGIIRTTDWTPTQSAATPQTVSPRTTP
ncbi:MAG: sodium:solute symporter family transporter, partial [Longimicrobiales bacterium]